ncbi:hypothetical protein Droror1_Dr00013347 [Drosera rotundifolia]
MSIAPSSNPKEAQKRPHLTWPEGGPVHSSSSPITSPGYGLLSQSLSLIIRGFEKPFAVTPSHIYPQISLNHFLSLLTSRPGRGSYYGRGSRVWKSSSKEVRWGVAECLGFLFGLLVKLSVLKEKANIHVDFSVFGTNLMLLRGFGCVLLVGKVNELMTSAALIVGLKVEFTVATS